jgi:hypothetical protein
MATGETIGTFEGFSKRLILRYLLDSKDSSERGIHIIT